MATDEKAAEKTEAPAPSGGERSPLFSLTGWIVIIGICLIEGVIFMVVANWSKLGVGTGGDDKIKVGYWQLDPAFQVTIFQDGLPHGFETKIALGIEKDLWDDDKKRKEQLLDRSAKVRDTILTVLQRQTWPDVMYLEGQDKLRKELLKELQGILKQEVVQEVCFESFSPR